MGLLKKLSQLFTTPPKSDQYVYWIYVKCSRCGENLKARVNLRNDLSIEYGNGEGDTYYFTRKILIGEKLCFQSIEVELTFDRKYQLTDRKISGGEFITEEEFEAGES
jgi:hypothetical protein